MVDDAVTLDDEIAAVCAMLISGRARPNEQAALRSALARLEASRWRLIAEAPKNGTYIIVARAGEDIGGGPVEITYWYETGPYYRYEPNDQHPGLFRQVQISDGYRGWNGNGHRATHWMPLPSPPSATSEGGEG